MSGGAPKNNSPLDWPREAGLGPELAREIRAEVRRRRRVRWTALAASTAACAAVWLAWPRTAAPALPETPAAVRVAAPERRTLPDGSVAELRPGAELRVEFSADTRRVVLAAGEAHFTVAKNPARPFVVAAGGVEARAVGTAFAVAHGTAAIDVIVTEGRVAVSGARQPEPALLDAGSGASVGTAPGAPAVSAFSADEMARRLAWRVPRLVFAGTPLPEVVRMFAAHGGARLTIADDAIRGVTISGVLRADNTDALLQLLADDHGIEAVRDGVAITLRRRR